MRAIYGPDRIYSEMVKRARQLWRDLEQETGRELYTETGALWMVRGDDSYIREAIPILEDLGFPVDNLPTTEAARRYPQIDFAGIDEIYLERYAGILLARESCRLVVERFVTEGGAYKRGTVTPLTVATEVVDRLTLTTGEELRADYFVFACGPWLGRVLPDVLTDAIQPTRQEVYYFGVPQGSSDWSPERLPVWVELADRVVYGFPDSLGRGFKIADDTRGKPIDPSTAQRTPTPELISTARSYLSRRFPSLAQAPLLEARVCQYENSPDGQLILDRHPTATNVWAAGGGSGHGFKLSPAIGEQMAQAILRSRPLDSRFSLARLSNTRTSRTQFEFEEDSR